MNKEIKNTTKHTFIYSIGNLSIKAIGLLLLPLYTSKLSVSDYGKLGILEVTAQFLIVVLGLNLYTAMIRWCSGEKSEERRKSVIFSTYTFLFFILLLFTIILQSQRAGFSVLYFGDKSFSKVFGYIFYIVFLEIINILSLSLLRMKEKSLLYISVVIIKLTITLSLTIYFITSLGMRIAGIFLAQLIGNGTVFILLLPLIIRNVNFKFDLRVLKKMFKYSVPLIFSSVSLMLLSIGDRFFIKFMLNDAELGIYSLAYKFAGVINMLLIQSFALGYLPIAYKMINDKNAISFYKRIFFLYSSALILLSFSIALFAREIIEIFAQNKDYWVAYKFVPVLSLVFIMKGLQYIFSLGFHIKKKTHYNAIIVMAAVLINFTLDYFLISKYSLIGAIIATLISSSFITIMFYQYSQRLLYIPYEIKKVAIFVLLATGFYFISIVFPSPIFLYRILFKLGLLIAFSLIVYRKILPLHPNL